MTWKEYMVLCGEEAVEAVTAVFHQLGGNGVSVESSQYVWHNPALESWAVRNIPADLAGKAFWMVKSYFPADAADMLPALQERFQVLEEYFDSPPRLFATDIEEQAWQESWRKYYHAVKIGRRLVVKPSWEPYQPAADEVVAEVDPGMAFGTGLHATTRFCLELLEKFAAGQERALDCGCGSGILSIAAAKLGVQEILAVDLDEEAVRVSRENIQLNALESRITVKEANAITVLREERFDLVLANLTADVLLHLLPAAQSALNPGACLIGSGIWYTCWEEVRDRLAACGFISGEVLQDSEWVGFAAYRLRPGLGSCEQGGLG